MKAPFTGVRLAVAALIALSQAGCGAPGAGVGAGPRPGRGDDTVKAADLNLRPRDQVKEGGTLRWGIGEFPAQWNRNHIDGNLASAAVISDALLPSAFLSDGKARLSADRDYVLDARITRRNPRQVVTYTLNPKARWSDGRPITWADYRAQRSEERRVGKEGRSRWERYDQRKKTRKIEITESANRSPR